MDNVPSNSHFHFSFLVSQSTNKAPWINKWFWYQFYTYLLLEKNIKVNDFEKRAEDWINKKFEIPQEKHLDLLLQPLTDIHLHSHILGEIEPNQNISSVYLFAAIGILILFVALINFVNLKTAHAVNRAKEVGVRKSIGAERKQLISQFIIESVIISLTAFIISMICVQVLLPLVNNYFEIQIETNAFKNYNIISALFVISLFAGLLSGIYPAFVLSRFNPSMVLKGTSKLTGKSGLRRAMVIFQFGASAFLIISSIAIYNQMNFINKKELGFNKDQIITFNIRSENLRKNYKAFENALLSNSNIAKVSMTATLPGGGDWGIDYKAEGINDADIPGARMLVVDDDFIDTYGIEISEGRKFSSDFSTDTLTYILNETAAKALNWDNPINKKISIPILKRDWGNVIGVVKDFHFRSLHEVIEPLIIYIAPTDWAAYVSVKLKPGSFNSEISFIEKTWKTFDPEHPLTFTFFDEDFGKLYLADQRDMELITYATIIAIFIACLGLYALISFTLTQKTKEIGIRKVLGAKITDIVFLVSKEFLVLLIIANLIAWPAAFYFLEDWFENFAYRTEISLTIFIIGSFAGLIIAFSVISYKVVKAASKNPVNSLRTE